MRHRCLSIVFIFLFTTLQLIAIRQEESCIKPAGSTFSSCQLFSTWQNPNGSSQLVTAATKFDTPLGTRVAANRMKTGYMRTLVHKNHPTGSALFPQESTLASLLNSFLDSVEVLVEEDYEQQFAKGKDNYFITYFSRIQMTILHELYQYLLSIYTAFNMTHISNMWDFLENETNQALNKKTMIINHLVNVIEAQANQAITMRFPNMPQHLATRTGAMMMKQDYGANLNLMLEGEELRLFEDINVQKYYKLRRELYTEIFGKYLKFFKSYTATLQQDDPVYGSKFVKHAQDIQKILNAKKPTINKKGSIKEKVTALRTIKTINPPLFFYEEETLRGLKIIPRIARDLPPNSQKVPWPAKLVEDARTSAQMIDKFGNVISNQPRAYFLDKDGNITKSVASAIRLFVNIPTAQHMYSQKVQSQPDWLNSTEGVMLMLRACLGDYTALFDPLLKKERIIDPCLSCIILNAALKVGLFASATEQKQACDDCEGFLEILRKIIAESAPEPAAPPPPPPPGPM